MAELIRMPKMSDTMEEGVIAAWHKNVGDTVDTGDLLAEVETDKATMELESYWEGTLLYIGPKEKDAVPVDGVIAIIGEEGENVDDLLKQIESGGAQQPQAMPEPSNEQAAVNAGSASGAAAAASSAPAPTATVDSVAANIIRMPNMSDTMEEGTIAAWHKKVGDAVDSGDLLAEVETDKATMELESYEEGTLLYIGVEEGKTVPVDGIIAIVGEEGADYQVLLNAEKTGGVSSQPAEAMPAPGESSRARQPQASPDQDQNGQSSSEERLKASPLAKRLAQEKGINIQEVKGSGEGGRIVKRDVENYQPQAKATTEAHQAAQKEQPQTAPQKESKPQAATPMPAFAEDSYEDLPLSQMRKTIAKRLGESKFQAPHFYVTMEIDMTKMWSARKQMNELSPVKISFNDIVIKACAVCLRKHPAVNSSWLGDKIRMNHNINIGMAVAIDQGLIVPVIRHADMKTLSQIATEAKDFGGRAKEGKLKPEEYQGNTFSISNMGMFGVEEFTAIINPPDSCILAVGGIKDVVVPDGENGFKTTKKMKVTLSSDHRSVDGATAAGFLVDLKDLLEEPLKLII